MPVDRIISNLEKLNINDLILDALKPESGFIAQLNRDQLEVGQGNDGKKLKPKYKGASANASSSNKAYARRKSTLNSKPGFGTPDLKVKGTYHQSLETKFGSDEIELISTDPKDRFLERYEKRKGISDSGIEKVQNAILPDLQQAFLNAILK